MPKLFPIWESFAAGEISPRLFTRTSSPVYAEGLALLENCISTSHGPSLRRGGSLFLGAADPAVTDAKLFQFNYRKNIAFLLAIESNGDLVILDVSHGIVPVEIITLTSPWDTESKVRGVQVQMLPTGSKEMVMVEETTVIQVLKYDPEGATPALQWILEDWTIQNPPSEWTGDIWPGAITLFQGRLWVAATPDEPERIWASRSGNYNNFQTGSNDDHALDFELAQQGKIEWMVGTKTLIVGTVNGEHIISRRGGVNEDPITAANVDALQQSGYGSLAIQPPRVGQLVLYISPDGKKVRDIGYKWEEDGWLSRDLSFMSEHIPKADPLRGLTFAQHPENVIYAVTISGKFIGSTYDLNSDVIGWHRHNTQGAMKSMIAIDVEGSSDVYWAVIRKDLLMLERMVPSWEELDILDNPMFADSCTITNHNPADVTFSVPHLPDEMVVVTVDGAVQPPVLLDGNGDGETQFPGLQIIAGLRYDPKLVSLPMDRDMPNEAGTIRGHMKRFNKIHVLVLDSLKPIINGKRPPDRTPSTPMDTAEQPSDDDFIVVNVGWDRFAQIEVVQDLPVGMTVAGIYGEMEADSVS